MATVKFKGNVLWGVRSVIVCNSKDYVTVKLLSGLYKEIVLSKDDKIRIEFINTSPDSVICNSSLSVIGSVGSCVASKELYCEGKVLEYVNNSENKYLTVSHNPLLKVKYGQNDLSKGQKEYYKGKRFKVIKVEGKLETVSIEPIDQCLFQSVFFGYVPSIHAGDIIKVKGEVKRVIASKRVIVSDY